MKRILIHGANWVGDALMTTPAISCVRRAFPAASLSILTVPTVEGIYSAHPWIDEVILYERSGRHRGTAGKGVLAQELRKRRFDMGLLFPNSFESALLSFLGGIRMRIGYEADGRAALLTHGIKRNKAVMKRHQVGYYLELPQAMGWKERDLRLSISISEMDHQWVKERLAAREWEEGRPLVAIAPGASYGPAKKWDLSRHAKVADALIADVKAKVIIVGSFKDRADGRDLLSQIRGGAWDLTGGTTLSQLGALLHQCSLLITNDSGAMHVGAATQTPIIALFGPTDPLKTSPYGVRHRILRHEVDCSPCLLRECPTDQRCMKGIKVDEVLTAAFAFLKSGPPRREKDIAVFLDRDGTINEEVGYLSRCEDLRLIPGAAEAVRLLNQHGLRTVIVSNQSGVARGYLTEEEVARINERLEEVLGERGAFLDGIYFCPHHPEIGDPPYRALCDCRKPRGGMLERAERDLNLDLSRSYVIGDHLSDVALGKGVGMKSILVLTGHGEEQYGKIRPDRDPHPDLVSGDLCQAIQWILRDLKEA